MKDYKHLKKQTFLPPKYINHNNRIYKLSFISRLLIKLAGDYR